MRPNVTVIINILRLNHVINVVSPPVYVAEGVKRTGQCHFLSSSAICESGLWSLGIFLFVVDYDHLDQSMRIQEIIFFHSLYPSFLALVFLVGFPFFLAIRFSSSFLIFFYFVLVSK